MNTESLATRRLQTFLHYTSRFNAIIQDLPLDARIGYSDRTVYAERKLADAKFSDPKCKLAVVRLFDLVAEEYFLHQKGELYEDAWDIWFTGFISFLAHPPIRRIWQETNKAGFWPEFVALTENALKAAAVVSPPAVGLAA